MNFSMALKLKAMWDGFSQRHPKFPQFLSAVSREGISQGTILEITVTTPEGKSFTSNLKVSQEDLDALKSLRELQP